LGVLLGYRLADYLDLRERLRNIEQILALHDRQSAAQPPKPAQPSVVIAEPVFEGDELQLYPELELEPGTGELREETAAATHALETFSPEPASSPHGPIAPAMSSPLREAVNRFFTGGNLLVKVGVVVLFFGVAFLLRYAAEHSRLPIELRLTGAALGAIALLAIGWRLRYRRKVYALVLQGGSIGIFYLTVFAAVRLYELAPQSFAFAVLAALSILSSVMAVIQDSRSLACFSVTGGFLAPVLASTGQGSHVALFSYYALLNAGILGIAWFKAWRILNLIGYLFTFGIASIWGFNYYRPEYFSTTEPFLICFFLFYAGVAVLFALRQPPELKGYVDGALVFGVPLIAFALQTSLVGRFQYGLALSAFAAGFFYLTLAWALFLKGPASAQTLVEAFLAIGTVFATIAVPLAVDARWTASAWALEAAAIVWIGVRQNRMTARVFGALLQVGAGIAFISQASVRTGSLPVLNGFYLGCIAVSFAGLFTSFYLHRRREQLQQWEAPLGWTLGVWGLLWWFGAGIHEIDVHAPRELTMGGMLLFFAFSCGLADYLERRLRWPLLNYLALCLLPAMLLVLDGDTERSVSHPFAQGGFVAWPIAFAVLYHILRRRDDETEAWRYLKFFHAGALWLLSGIFAWELSWQINNLVGGAGSWRLVAWGIAPALMLLLISTAGDRMSRIVGDHLPTYVTLGAGPIAAFVWLWSLLMNLSNPGDPWPLPYLPIINPLDVAVGFVFTCIGFWFLRLRSVTPEILTGLPPRLIPSLIAASLFLWLNAILVRTIHHWGKVAFSLRAMFDSVLLQSSLSVFWGLLALLAMATATRKGIREVWLAGAGLMGIVVIKLFLVDLSKSGTVERIVSFMSVGILLLVIGYFSPLPPRSKKEATQI
jgi:uncharacterized membrane protein